jgi:hypothetical protein
MQSLKYSRNLILAHKLVNFLKFSAICIFLQICSFFATL